MTTAVIAQARIGSSRLPGKVLADLAGKPVLAHALGRCDRIPGIDVVVCAIPDTAENDCLVPVIEAGGVQVFRGSEHDVLHRYMQAAKLVRADIIVRITADCPMIDPEICGQVIALRQQEDAAYASNVHPRSFPHGLDCEVFTFEALERAYLEAFALYDREHVTPFMIRNERKISPPTGRYDLTHLRWTLDYPEDLDFIRAVFAVLEPRCMADVLDILREHPEIEAINACRKAA